MATTAKPTIRKTLARIRSEIDRYNPNRSCWVCERLSRQTKDDMLDVGIEVRNRPDVGGDGFLSGVGQWRHVPSDYCDHGGWRDL